MTPGNRMAAPAPSPSPDWLANLARVWVERWLAYGGYLVLDPHCDRLSMGHQLHSRLWRSKNPWGQRLWHDGWCTGRWRELLEMAHYIPGLCDAILCHVATDGVCGADGAFVMARSAEEMSERLMKIGAHD